MVSTDTSNEGKAGILKCKPAFKVAFKGEKLPTTGTCSFSLIANTGQWWKEDKPQMGSLIEDPHIKLLLKGAVGY